MRNPLADKVVDIKPSGIRKFFDVVSEMPDAISLGVGEPEVAKAVAEMAERLYENKVLLFFAVEKDTVDTWRTQVAQYGVLASIAIGKVEVLEVMDNSIVVFGFDYRTQSFVNPPLELSDRYLFPFFTCCAIASPS